MRNLQRKNQRNNNKYYKHNQKQEHDSKMKLLRKFSCEYKIGYVCNVRKNAQGFQCDYKQHIYEKGYH